MATTNKGSFGNSKMNGGKPGAKVVGKPSKTTGRGGSGK